MQLYNGGGMSNLNTELLDAAKNGDFEKVKRLRTCLKSS
ncbi:hypothetical protein WCLE_004120 [Wolbachia endosymbiont of Cimex lectularius]|nr:hypothetical protein WCLE_004120 [Wolbachia endosymbiont of Cimex lectularius]